MQLHQNKLYQNLIPNCSVSPSPYTVAKMDRTKHCNEGKWFTLGPPLKSFSGGEGLKFGSSVFHPPPKSWEFCRNSVLRQWEFRFSEPETENGKRKFRFHPPPPPPGLRANPLSRGGGGGGGGLRRSTNWGGVWGSRKIFDQEHFFVWHFFKNSKMAVH